METEKGVKLINGEAFAPATPGKIKIHLGCGRHKLDGYINMDAMPTNGVDPDMFYVLAADNPLPFEDGSASEILAVHLFEHFTKLQALALLKDWLRVLRGKGRLILEMPDLKKCCENFARDPTNHSLGMAGLYGDQDSGIDFYTHKFGWYPASLEKALYETGFRKIEFKTPQWHGKKRYNRDLRVEAVSP